MTVERLRLVSLKHEYYLHSSRFSLKYSRDNGITFPCMFIVHISFTISIHIPNRFENQIP